MNRRIQKLAKRVAMFALALSTVLVGSLPAHATNDVWEIDNPANVSSVDNYLFAVTSIAASDVWAVGTTDDANGNLPLAEHWNGTSWSIVSTDSNASYNSQMFGVAAVDSSDVWAVGFQNSSATDGPYAFDTRPTASGSTLVEKYNGTSWSIQSSPNPGSGFNTLTGVCFTSTTNGWAVGYYYNGTSGAYNYLILHWNGTSWSVPSGLPNVFGTNKYLYGISCRASNDIWAVGNADSSTLILRYNGSSWTWFTSPSPGTAANFLEGVACVSSTDCKAVGEKRDTGSTTYTTLILRYNGTNWATQTSPNPATSGDNVLSAAAYVSSNWAWAVGTYNKPPYQTLILDWDGTSWSQTTSPNQGTGDNHLHGVSVEPGYGGCTTNDSWAVGWYHDTSSGRDLTLAERYTASAPCSP